MSNPPESSQKTTKCVTVKGSSSSSSGGSPKVNKKGFWTEEEDRILMEYISLHGKGKWNHIAKVTGLKRCGKSLRLRWLNYLSPNIKHGEFTEDEEDLVIRLHKLLGNRWSLIAGRMPGRTDNQVKNHWNTHLSKKLGHRKPKPKSTSGSYSSCSQSKEVIEDCTARPVSSNINKVTSQHEIIEGSGVGGYIDHGKFGLDNSVSEEMAMHGFFGYESFNWLSGDDYGSNWGPNNYYDLIPSVDDDQFLLDVFGTEHDVFF